MDKQGNTDSIQSNITPDLAQEHQDSDSSTTKATVTTDNITVTRDAPASQQALNNVNRDADDAHRTLEGNEDVNSIVVEQQARAAAAARASQAVAKTVGDIGNHYLDKAQKEAYAAQIALDAAKEQGDEAAIQQAEAALATAQQDINNWKEGGAYR